MALSGGEANKAKISSDTSLMPDSESLEYSCRLMCSICLNSSLLIAKLDSVTSSHTTLILCTADVGRLENGFTSSLIEALPNIWPMLLLGSWYVSCVAIHCRVDVLVLSNRLINGRYREVR